MTLELLHTVVDGRNLTQTQAESAMRSLLAGESTPVLTASFLTALRMKGETVEELAGFARAMRSVAVPLDIGPEYRPLLDTCGTGGNKVDAFNISTAVAFVVAGAGVRIAKHGNRAITSKCGSADVLEALGVNTRVEPDVIARSIREAGIGFLFAPTFHTATRNVQPVRLELKFRTAFNYLGPLTNPAGAEMQVCGTWSEEAAEKIAGALALLGLERGYVVHGSDGLGEVTLTGKSTVFWVRGGHVHKSTVMPDDFGFEPCKLEALRGGGAETNRAIAESILNGEKGPRRDIVLMNSALALIVAGKAATFTEGVAEAAASIDSGAARKKLDALRKAVS
ncbi:MAG: anthranilate phosphoribosyltransferase [Acidobacteriota bacterium]|nr:anthranilate phosphoribosyltransferase [Acidobacteriota bacterium]